MTQEELQAIKERCEKATKGPWFQHCTPCGPHGQMMYHEQVESSATYPAVPVCARARLDNNGKPMKARQTFDNMVFIAHSRQDIPLLLAEISRLQAANCAIYEEAAKVAEETAVKSEYWADKHMGVKIAHAIRALAAQRGKS